MTKLKRNFCLLTCFSLNIISLAAQHPVGVNLAPYRDWSPEFLFKDAFKSCREWITFDPMNPNTWDTGFGITPDAQGYPIEVPFTVNGSSPQMARTLLFWDLANGYPSSQYSLLWEGSGSIRVRHNGAPMNEAITFSSSPGHFTADGQRGIIIEIMQSTLGDEVRNIHFIMPGFEDNFETQPFHPELLAFLDHFDCIRWMDLMNTNNSPVIEWANRTLPDYYSQAQPTGVAYEYLAQLSSLASVDAWVNIPHQASDAYIEAFAQFLEDHINPDKKIYIEYSNELWNTAPAFPQSAWVAQQGIAMGFATNPGRMFTAKRSAEIFQIFQTVFDDDSRLVKVLAGQAGNANVAETILDAYLNNLENVNPNGVGVDALAIAPYFGNFLTNAASVNDALNQAEASLGLAFDRITNHLNLLSSNNWQIPLITYEGGQHLDANNAASDAFFNEANRSAEMGELYCQYLSFWYENAGGLFMHFNSHTKYDQSGSWGLKEYLGQPDSESPKFMALLHAANDDGVCSTPTHEVVDEASASLLIYPNPAFHTVQITGLTTTPAEMAEIYDLQGQRLLVAKDFPETVDVSMLPNGFYILVLKTGGATIGRGKFVKS